MNTGPAPLSSPLVAPPHRAWRNWLRGLILLALSGLLMTLSFPSFNLWFVAPLCLVPWVICILRRPLDWRWLLTYYVFAVAWFFANLYWLTPVTVWGTLALCCFIALYWVLFAWAVRRLVVQLRLPALVAVPLAWVACEYLRATLLTGFPWFLLGNALAPRPVLIQVADLLGVWAVSFFAAMTAGWIVDLLRLPLRQGKQFSPAILRLTALYLATAAFVVVYGLYRLNQNPFFPGPRVAVVQETIPQSQKDLGTPEERRDIFERHMRLTRAAAAERPDLVIWPETMVPWTLSKDWLEIDLPALRRQAQDARAAATAPADATQRQRAQQRADILARTVDQVALSQDFDAALHQITRPLSPLPATAPAAAARVPYLLVGAPLFSIDGKLNQNVALLYHSAAGAATQASFPRESDFTDQPFYAKRHLVPFGEFVPFKHSFPTLHRWLLSLTPYPDFDYSLVPGDAWTRFEISSDGRTFRFGTPICYEDVMPYPCRAFVHPEGGQKSADFLVSMSNDGWYGSAAELDQHLQMDQLRAVENRVPVARSVNSGNSGFVDSNGRVAKLVSVGGQTRFVAGYAVLDLPLDRRISLYSRIGDLFPIVCGIVTALAVGWTIVRPRRRIPGEEPPPPAAV